jgi:hypothetical protein
MTDWSRIVRPLGIDGMSGAPRLLKLVYVERESTTNSAACRRDLRDPTRWFAITYAIATVVNLREELTTVLVIKAMLVSSLHSASRLTPTHLPLASKISSGFPSWLVVALGRDH